MADNLHVFALANVARRPRVYRDRLSPFEAYDDSELYAKYR